MQFATIACEDYIERLKQVIFQRLRTLFHICFKLGWVGAFLQNPTDVCVFSLEIILLSSTTVELGKQKYL